MSKKKWLKMVINADPHLLEPLSDFLVGVLEAGVEAAAVDEPGYGTVNCYIEDPDPDPSKIDQIVSEVSQHLELLSEIFDVELPSLSYEMIGEQDWGKSWKEFFKPFTIVEGLVISPSWEQFLPEKGEKVIVMDPGMAFGTGHHQTTSLCLEFVRESLKDEGEKTVLDVGTGTGILAMAAVHFNGSRVLAIDNDPEAVSSARENVELNHMVEKIEVSQAPLSELTEQYDIVVANIVHDVLIEMAVWLTAATNKGGSLILSGILAGEQLESIKGNFQSRGFEVTGEKSGEEWAAIRFIKS